MIRADVPWRVLKHVFLLPLLAVAMLLGLAQTSFAATTAASMSMSATNVQPPDPFAFRAYLVAYEARAALAQQTATPATRTYKVRNGNTLSGIAQRFYGRSAVWPCVYDVNKAKVHNPDEIHVGQILLVPVHLKLHGCHAPPSGTIVSASTTSYTQPASGSSPYGGTLSCGQLESLWESAGGSPASAYMASKIAMAESSGEQYAKSPSDDIGYWQINVASWGALATYNPFGNAKAAIYISHNGTDWWPWVTYQTGAYQRYC